MTKNIENDLKIIINLLKISGLSPTFLIKNNFYIIYCLIIFLMYTFCLFKLFSKSIVFSLNLFTIINAFSNTIYIIYSFLSLLIYMIYFKKFGKLIKNIFTLLNKYNYEKNNSIILIKQIIFCFILVFEILFACWVYSNYFSGLKYFVLFVLTFSFTIHLILLFFIILLINLLYYQFKLFNRNLKNKKLFKKFNNLIQIFQLIQNTFSIILFNILILYVFYISTVALYIINLSKMLLIKNVYFIITFFFSFKMILTFLQILDLIKACTNVSKQVCM